MVDRTRREFSDDDIEKIAETYHRWREGRDYQDVPGFCKSASLEEVRSHDHVLTPGRYVGAEVEEDDGVSFEERFAELEKYLEDYFSESEKLTNQIRAKLGGIRL